MTSPPLEVDFIYAEDCPHAEASRNNLIRAFSQLDIPAHWAEHLIDSTDVPPHVRGFGSPTILINGVDVAGLNASAAAEASRCCRLYAGSGAPSVELIVNALANASTR